MGKKRKSDATRLDEVDRSMYSTFCSAASSLSQLYTQTMNQQRLSFQAGERHAMEKLYNWILRQQEDGVRVTTGDILAYMQNEIDYVTEDPPPSPRLHQQPPPTNPGIPVSYNAFGAATTPTGQQNIMRVPGNSDQTKNNVFSNALSSPVRRSLQQYHLTQGNYNANNGNSNATRNNENSANPNPPSSNDTSMDMHDSPGHDSIY